MTALPVPPAPPPMTAAEFAALPEDAEARFELQDGALVLPPRPVPRHQDCLGELFVQLRSQVPQHLKVLLEVDIDLQLVPPGQPGTVRAPDLVVVTRRPSIGSGPRAACCVPPTSCSPSRSSPPDRGAPTAW